MRLILALVLTVIPVSVLPTNKMTGNAGVAHGACIENNYPANFSYLVGGQRRNHYKTYHNARFDYSISYPANILIPQGESVNGDGQKFLSRDGRTEMLVFGYHNSLNQSLRHVYEEETSRSSEHPNRVITYQVLRGDWFVVSGIEDGRIFYQKTLLRGGVFKTLRIEYDESKKQVFNPMTAKIAGSFKG